eukprot:6178537-Pleurochrysis_carterae.AAC.3
MSYEVKQDQKWRRGGRFWSAPCRNACRKFSANRWASRQTALAEESYVFPLPPSYLNKPVRDLCYQSPAPVEVLAECTDPLVAVAIARRPYVRPDQSIWKWLRRWPLVAVAKALFELQILSKAALSAQRDVSTMEAR